MTISPILLGFVEQASERSRPFAFDGTHDVEQMTLFNRPQLSSWKRSSDCLFGYLQQKGVIDENGQWILADPPALPSIGQEQLSRLNWLLNTPCRIQQQLNGKKSSETTLARFISNMGYGEVELIGSGVMWLLGEEYFRRFLLALDVPDELITEDLFEDMRSIPQDFDFRFSGSGCRMNRE